jgi:hypothetical protein
MLKQIQNIMQFKCIGFAAFWMERSESGEVSNTNGTHMRVDSGGWPEVLNGGRKEEYFV